MAWHAKEVLRSIYGLDEPDVAAEFVDQLGQDLQDESCPVEVHSLGRTLFRWRDQIVGWHRARVSNGPTEAMNNPIKRIKRVGFGFRRFATTGSGSCSTPGGRTGPCWPRSHPAESEGPQNS